MSKRVGAVPEETRDWILAAAKIEFSKNGFQKTSLRQVCSTAGVTTGALYFFFQGKDDLFQTVLAQVTDPFTRLVEEHYLRERQFPGQVTEEGSIADLKVTEMLIDLHFNNRETWDILTHNINHPAVQAFLDHLIDISTEHYQYLLEETPSNRQIDVFGIHQFVHMQVDTMLTLFSHDFTREEMIAHSKTVVRMLRGAFRALLTD